MIRDIARFVLTETERRAQETRAIQRGHVESFTADGRAIVLSPNGARVLVRQSELFEVAEGQAVTLTRGGGGRLEILAPSAFGGGRGAPVASP